MKFFVRNSKNGPVRDYHWSVGPSATRFLFEIMRSRCFVRDCERLGKVGPFGVILGTGSLSRGPSAIRFYFGWGL